MNINAYLRDRSFLGTITLTHTTELEMNSAVNTLTNKHSEKTEINKGKGRIGSVERVTKSIANLLVIITKIIVKKVQIRYIPNSKYNS